MKYADIKQEIKATLKSIGNIQDMYAMRRVRAQNPDEVKIVNASAQRDMEARLEQMLKTLEVEVEYDCNDCEDTGEQRIPAHQHGGNIVDEDVRPCHCQPKVVKDHE